MSFKIAIFFFKVCFSSFSSFRIPTFSNYNPMPWEIKFFFSLILFILFFLFFFFFESETGICAYSGCQVLGFSLSNIHHAAKWSGKTKKKRVREGEESFEVVWEADQHGYRLPEKRNLLNLNCSRSGERYVERWCVALLWKEPKSRLGSVCVSAILCRPLSGLAKG